MQLATMPLDHVPVVSLDLETTGFARSDRIVQIGAIRSDDATRLRALVRPGIPIPAEHPHSRIDDAMVAGADDAADGAAAAPLADRRASHTRLQYRLRPGCSGSRGRTPRVEWSWSAALCLRQLATCLLARKR